MSLNSFGSVLGFAEEMETADESFYSALLKREELKKYENLLGFFIKDAKKNLKNIARTRRENVTEMILEPIKDFSKDPFLIEVGDPDSINPDDFIEASIKLETRAVDFYLQAAEKIKSLSEVARALKLIAKKRKARLSKIDEYK